MPHSMTGFGRAEIRDDRYEISIEIRSLNNRYLDIGLKLPRSLSAYEYLLKEMVKKKIARGKLTATVIFKHIDSGEDDFKINHESVQYYMHLLGEIKKQSGLNDEISLDHLLQFRDLVEPEETALQDPEIETILIDAFKRALDELIKMRAQEAKNLTTDIIARLATIEEVLKTITDKAKESPRRELDKLFGRLQEKIHNKEVDQDRLELELAFIADRVDVTEECTRLASHIQLFSDVLNNKDEVGKQLTFLLQEMHRETNTIGSKTSDITISHEMIRLKEEIEKLREQVQNLE